ncbi:DMT family transporter [Novosphingobium sp. G106]|uniref:DMT family transporter n=1 Tax=Novosphingobium sp. G106 TaxID=2849500 RepID=UPI001C2D737E|nr:DMT family transporter [Novosphingobium sp. G106]MBV1689653.1 DMT family transporter [Novosphingobium sp. G106]
MTHARSPLPFLSVTAGIATFSTMDALMKSASMAGGVYNALLLRSIIGGLLMLPIWLLARGRWPALAVLKIHALRSAVVAAMAGLFFWALVRLPMAEAMALSFIAPLIALYLAAVVLGETIRPTAIVASVLGLAGVAVITAARFSTESPAEAAPAIGAVLLSAFFYAWNLILQRQQALVAKPFDVALFQSLFMALFLILAAPVIMLAWKSAPAWPTPALLRDVTGAAVLAAIALMLLSWGYARAEAQALVPLEYTAFVWAALAGYVWFSEAVTAATIAGTALIVLGCWIATRSPATPTVPAAALPPAP